ncbi:DEAD/DEAH box helicase family protein [Hymenobacter sp. ISL-91]|uniref:DEAD/DEAH box helicase n=1 Tax=Hymenobacter sp. ISL-91 TaxID=2819151 RepID=UPI001BE7E3BF|nr:SNF2-related protein [Hymenobacter sp. ISL-91]MBT2556954.1 DEAD/DEAH box helicase family protein [Hymenobacter sp. ISL-91]
MKVSTTEPFQIVYSLLEHEYLGYLFESYVVQRNERGQLTLLHQTVSAKNAAEFAAGLDATDFELVALTDQISQDAVIKEFGPKKKTTPADFFLKTYDPEKGDKPLQDAICRYVQERMGQILARLAGKCVFIMGRDGEPTWREISLAPEPASVLFHFRRNEENTHYFPTIQYQGQKLDFQYKNTVIVCEQPAWLLVGDVLHNFRNEVDGKKLRPFLNKKFIVIPRQVEDSYFHKFVAPLVESFDVHARGFDIRSERYVARPQLTFSDAPAPAAVAPAAAPRPGRRGAGTVATAASAPAPPANHIHFDLSFRYGPHTVPSDHDKRVCVKLEKQADNYVFHRLIRNLDQEQEIVRELQARALQVQDGRAMLEKATAFRWLHDHTDELTQRGFTVKQGRSSGKDYFIGAVSVEVGITETNDWFDVHGVVRFGEFEIPFIKLRPYILNKRPEFRLPNGQIAVIPEEWFAQYLELFAFAEEHNEGLSLRKHHVSLVADLQSGNLATVLMSRKLEQLREFEAVAEHPMPATFRGELRPYQKAGYDWLHFVQNYQFGGCLADDMGLGKTIQALALLLQRKETGAANGAASLLVMPTSLVYNWMTEAFKFAPGLRLLIYTGTYREKNVAQFADYDVVLTSYGIVRLDIELLKTYQFDYVILDESQAIKNPGSTTSQAVRQLPARHRLILTGTPVENSTMDLWSQMSFINPGLLGTQAFFRKEFLKPIEKHQDEDKRRRLHALIKPFILRRHKAQVATELPAKVENLNYCAMTEEQQQFYEETKSHYRNLILQNLEETGSANTQFVLLQGLTKLRLIANHPRLADPEYTHESGKLREVVRMIKNVAAEGHKVLVFSQFVKHLDLVRTALDERQLAYAYLDGNTRDRHKEVTRFQETPELRVFLISLKAGGVGLNLTAADYVFLLDPWWNPAVEAQAVDRAHRIGQERTVFTYKFITRGTVEEKILALQRKKIQLVTDLISTDEAVIKNLTKEDIEELLG